MSSSDKKKSKEDGGLYETVKVIVQALILALVVRTFLFQPFNIPSGSMMDTLLVGDYLFVSKFSYGYSQYSFPMGLGPIPDRIWSEQPKRGDVVVFKLPSDNSTDYIKRVIGLPGDEIQMIDGVLHINGKAVKRERISDFVDEDSYGGPHRVERYRETLPNGVSYDTLDLTPYGQWDNTKIYKVPAGHYFMMGDNRDNSSDSRVPPDMGGVGYVPFKNLVGRADVIFFSVKKGYSAWMFWEWPWSVRWNRIFNSL